ncbi:MAG: hypothetical protein CMJ59_03350 [Planctomycetaceae bacterium]|nr:hypothetical protein [Planctomycetaceae bacterium]
MGQTRAVGRIVFLIGLVVAICAAAKMPVNDRDYPDTWPVFLVFAAIALIGLLLWRGVLQRAKSATTTAQPTSRRVDLSDLLGELLDRADAMTGQLESTTLIELDELLQTCVLPLAEARQQILERLGMKVGAELLITMAYGERMYNRTWSALADGHLEEAQQVFREGTEAFREARTVLP